MVCSRRCCAELAGIMWWVVGYGNMWLGSCWIDRGNESSRTDTLPGYSCIILERMTKLRYEAEAFLPNRRRSMMTNNISTHSYYVMMLLEQPLPWKYD